MTVSTNFKEIFRRLHNFKILDEEEHPKHILLKNIFTTHDQTTNSPDYLKSRAHALWAAVADRVSFPERLPTEALVAAAAPGNSAVLCVDSTLQILPTLSFVSKPSNKTRVSICCSLWYQLLNNVVYHLKIQQEAEEQNLVTYRINIHELKLYFFNLVKSNHSQVQK